MKKQSKSTGNKLSSAFQNIDLFGQNVQFIENGKGAFTTLFGALMSALIIMIVLTYSADKLLILKNYGDSNLTEYSENRYNDERELDYETSKFSIAIKFKSFAREQDDFNKLFDIQFYLS